MKIIYLITRSDVIGGASIHLIELAHGMVSRGHQIEIYVGGSGPFINLCKDNNLPVFPIPELHRSISLFKDFFVLLKLIKCIKKSSPDLVHLHSTKAGVIGRLASKICNTPCVFTAHGWAFTGGVKFSSKAIFAAIEFILAPLLNAVICVSNYDKNLALTYHVSEYKKIHVVHNGIIDIPCNHSRSKLNGEFRVVMVARFEPQKNQMLLLREIKNFRGENILFTFVGDGPTLSECKDYVANHGMGKIVSFLGARRDINDILLSSSLFVLASNWEGLPLTILEAMRAELPVIASNVGGVSECVIHGVSGYLVDNSMPQNFSEYIRELSLNPEKCQIMGKNGRQLFEEQFRNDTMIQKTEYVYSSLFEN